MDIEATVGYPSWSIDISHDWAVPAEVQLDDRGWLTSCWELGADRNAAYTAEDGLLSAFAALETATDEAIHEAAQRWGLLREWAARFPKHPQSRYREECDHAERRADGTTDKTCASCRPETVDEWRETARLVRVLVDLLSYGGGSCPLRILDDLPTHHLHVMEKNAFSKEQLTELRRHRRHTDESAMPLMAELLPNWDALSRWTLDEDSLNRPQMSMFFGDFWPDSRYVTAFILSPWIAKTTNIWFNGTRCYLRADCLAGELAIQLVSLADGGQRVETCSNCQGLFAPAKRRKRPGDASYCATCRGRPDFEALKRRLSRARSRHRLSNSF